MSRRLDGMTLAERSARSGVGAAATGRRDVVEDGRLRPVAGRHCWVHAAPLTTGGRTAALLVQWGRQGDGLWLGRVVYAVEGVVDETGRPIVVDTWLPSSLLEPS